MKAAASLKSTAPVKPVPPLKPISQNDPAAIRILKIGSCPSLSGKSTLTYHIGATSRSEVMLRVYRNSSTGFFSKEWIFWTEVQVLFDKIPRGKPITSFTLYPRFQGESMNTPGFLLAVLKQEGLVQPSKEAKRCYDRTDPKAFLTGVKTLMSSAVDLKADSKAQAAMDKTNPTVLSKKSPSKSRS